MRQLDSQGLKSHYPVAGKIESGTEVLLVLKTTAARLPRWRS